MFIKGRSTMSHFTLLASLCAISIFSAAHAVKPMPEKVVQIMQQPKYKHANWGILVKDTVTQEMLYEKNSNQLFMPGSTTKIFTAAALLHAYGDNYRFKTPVYANGALKDGVLKGDLIIVGQGDLTFGGRQEIGGNEIAFTKMDHTYANALPDSYLTPQDPLNALNALAKDVKAQGINRIDGNVLVDDRLFETIDLREQMLSPLFINENIIDIMVRSTSSGKPANVDWRPKVAGYKVINETVTVGPSEPLTVSVASDDEGKTIRVSGNIPQSDKQTVRNYTITDPKSFARDAFIQALRAQGITVNATATTELPPKSAYASMKPVAVWTSPPLYEYAKLILKVSHNIGANLCPLLLAAKNGETTFDAGMREFGKFTMDVVKVPADSFVFADGAGGDSNRLTPLAEIQLLDYVRTWPKQQFQRYFNGFPILGVDGSIEDFGKGSPAEGKVFGKPGTGIIINTSTSEFFLATQALSGYIQGQNGHLLEFMIAVNNGTMPELNDIFAIFDDECQMTMEFYNLSK